MRKKIGNGAAVDSMFLAGVKVVTLLAGIFSTMLLSHSLSLAEYGTYTQGNVVISVSVSLSILGLSDAVNYFYNGRKPEDQKRYVNTILMLEIVGGVLAAIFILVFSGAIANYFGNSSLTGLFIYIAFRPLLENMINTLQVLQISIGRAKVLAIRNLILSLSRVALVILTTMLTNSIKTIFIGYIIIDAITVVYFWSSFSSRDFHINPFKGIWSMIPPILKYSLPMAVYSLTKSLLKDMDKLVISHYEGTQSIAIYSNCSYALPFDVITNAFLVVMIPIITCYIARSDYKRAQSLFSDYIRIGYMTTCVFASAAAILAPELITFLFGEKYLPGLTVFILYLAVDMIKFANLSLVLSAKGWTRTLMVIALSSLGANLVLNLLFYRLFGFIGPAVASVLVSLVTTCLLSVYSSRALETTLTKLLNLKEVLLLIAELVIAAVPCLLLRELLSNAGWSALPIILVVGVLYVGSILLVNFKRLLQILRRLNSHKLSRVEDTEDK